MHCEIISSTLVRIYKHRSTVTVAFYHKIKKKHSVKAAMMTALKLIELKITHV